MRNLYTTSTWKIRRVSSCSSNCSTTKCNMNMKARISVKQPKRTHRSSCRVVCLMKQFRTQWALDEVVAVQSNSKIKTTTIRLWDISHRKTLLITEHHSSLLAQRHTVVWQVELIKMHVPKGTNHWMLQRSQILSLDDLDNLSKRVTHSRSSSFESSTWSSWVQRS